MTFWTVPSTMEPTSSAIPSSVQVLRKPHEFEQTVYEPRLRGRRRGYLPFLLLGRAIASRGHHQVRGLVRAHEADLLAGLLLEEVGVVEPPDPALEPLVRRVDRPQLGPHAGDPLVLLHELERRLDRHRR